MKFKKKDKFYPLVMNLVGRLAAGEPIIFKTQVRGLYTEALYSPAGIDRSDITKRVMPLDHAELKIQPTLQSHYHDLVVGEKDGNIQKDVICYWPTEYDFLLAIIEFALELLGERMEDHMDPEEQETNEALHKAMQELAEQLAKAAAQAAKGKDGQDMDSRDGDGSGSQEDGDGEENDGHGYGESIHGGEQETLPDYALTGEASGQRAGTESFATEEDRHGPGELLKIADTSGKVALADSIARLATSRAFSGRDNGSRYYDNRKIATVGKFKPHLIPDMKYDRPFDKVYVLIDTSGSMHSYQWLCEILLATCKLSERIEVFCGGESHPQHDMRRGPSGGLYLKGTGNGSHHPQGFYASMQILFDYIQPQPNSTFLFFGDAEGTVESFERPEHIRDMFQPHRTIWMDPDPHRGGNDRKFFEEAGFTWHSRVNTVEKVTAVVSRLN